NATTELGGDISVGTVFKVTRAGKLTTLYSLCANTNCADGASRYTELIQATDGNFYGTTQYGGDDTVGSVFTITPSGTLTTLHSFEMADGQNPRAGLAQATSGVFYGTTGFGGDSDDCPAG